MNVHSANPAAPQLVYRSAPGGARTVELRGAWSLQALRPRLRELRAELARAAAEPGIAWDLRAIEQLDHAGAALLWHAWGQHLNAEATLRSEHEAFFRRLAAASELPSRRRTHDWRRLAAWPVRWAITIGSHVHDLVALTGAVVLDLVSVLAHPRRAPWREISANVYRTGAQALGITALVGFLIGVVLSFLSANQLKNFGADVFIVNILGISITRELGPVLAAILVAGRSGSSMTAQLGVMRVTQELDAMSVMGIPQTARLVLPKVIALAVALPLLIVWTDAIALVGGMVAAYAELGLSYRYFVESLPGAVPVANLYLGFGKGVVFGVLIALLACHYGLRIRPNTESLGAGTTSSVVTAITIVIIVDAVFAVIYRDVGLAF